MVYRPYLLFIFPLVLTLLVQDIAGPLLNGGIARLPQATETLAAFGLAWGLTSLLESPLSQVRQLGLVLAEDRCSHRRLHYFVGMCGLGAGGVLALLSGESVGAWVVEELHGVGGDLADKVRYVLRWLVLLPLIGGLSRYYSGLLLRHRRTDAVSFATLASLASSGVVVVGVVGGNIALGRPMHLPVAVTYVGAFCQLICLWWAVRVWVLPQLAATDKGAVLPLGDILRFYWPLALIMVIQGGSRPLINLYIARQSNGDQALAILTVVYSLAHIPYGWLNELRSLHVAFRDQPASLRYIRRFIAFCGLCSFALMLLLFWTPLAAFLLEGLIGLEAPLAAACRGPLFIFSFFPLVVAVRAHFHGMALLHRRTAALAPSAPARLASIGLGLLLLAPLGLEGAQLGVAALLCGFVLEAVVVAAAINHWGRKG